MSAPAQARLSPWGRLFAAMAAVVECNSDDDAEHERLEARARMAGAAYAKHLNRSLRARTRHTKR